MRAKLLILWMFTACHFLQAQETVFSMLKNEEKQGDAFLKGGNYHAALGAFQHAARKNPRDGKLRVKMARCHYFLKDYQTAISLYDQFLRDHKKTSLLDLYYLAESAAATGQYDKAINSYREYLDLSPDDALVMQKVWRLNNVRYLYEDSVHYAVRPLGLNTTAGEMCPVPYKDGIVFMSNRKEIELIEKVDATRNQPFYRRYFSAARPDTTGDKLFYFRKPVLFREELASKFHAGPVCFYQKQTKAVFCASDDETAPNGGRTLHLFFAEIKDGEWKVTRPFPFNSKYYSVSDPSIDEDGTTLFFSCDKDGGIGGKDLYRSDLKNGQWSAPQNLGDHINTPYDEVFPYIFGKMLYFSSNGHPGMGGLDIFKVYVDGPRMGEVTNAGYPLNTHHDEFGIVMDSLETHGFFSSNRKNGGYDDDIYEFDMDLQTYPLEIKGMIKYKEHSWSDSSDLKTFPNAKLYLIDHIRNITVGEFDSDAAGNFSVVIPWFSKYWLKVVSGDNHENVVSLDIPKHRKSLGNHEIVVVKDAFRTNENPTVK